MLQFNKKLKVMCAAAALTLALIPVGCGTNDDNNDNINNGTTSNTTNGTNNNGIYDGTNGTNNNGVYDGSNNDNIIDDTRDAIDNGMGALESDVNGIDNGITNNNTVTTTNNNARIGTTTTVR